MKIRRRGGESTPARLSSKDVLHTPSKETPHFILEQEVDSEDTGAVQSILARDKKEAERLQRWDDFVKFVACCRFVFPQEEVSLFGLDDKTWIRLEQEFNRTKRESMGGVLAGDFALYTKLACPDKVKKLSLVDWVAMKKQLDWLRSRHDWQQYIDMAFRLRVLFPQRAEELGLAEIWSESKNQLDKWRLVKDWVKFSHTAARLKLLFPDHPDELGITEQDWKEMRAEFQDSKEGIREGTSLWSFLSLAMNMRLLAYPSHITSEGVVEVQQLSTDLNRPIPKLPDRDLS